MQRESEKSHTKIISYFQTLVKLGEGRERGKGEEKGGSIEGRRKWWREEENSLYLASRIQKANQNRNKNNIGQYSNCAY